MLWASLGSVGVLGKKRCGLVSLIKDGPGFVLTIAVTYHINFLVPRGCRGWEDPDLWQIDWMEFSDWNDADAIKPWIVSHEVQAVNMPHAVGNGKRAWKSISYCPSAFCDFVYYKSSCEPGVKTLEFLGPPWLLLVCLALELLLAKRSLSLCQGL